MGRVSSTDTMDRPDDVAVVADPDQAAMLVDPIRARVLEELGTPGSASTVAEALGLSRQKVNYHLRILEEAGLVRLVTERPKRGLTERVMVASARSYVLAPEVVAGNQPDPTTFDRLSSSFLVAVAARLVSEVGRLRQGARRAGLPLATLTIDSEICFATPESRMAFTADLLELVTTLAARYHSDDASDGRWHRLVIAAHPRPSSLPNMMANQPTNTTEHGGPIP